MRRIRYQVAMSLDGYIAGPNGEYDWIPEDPDIDFAELFAQFVSILIGRRSYEPMLDAGQTGMFEGKKTFLFSSTLAQADCPGVTVVNYGWEQTIAALREEPGKDIWLFGGGQLFRSLLAANLVDTVELAVVPVLLGSGIPAVPPPITMQKLELTGQRMHEKSGIVLLEYALNQPV